MSSGREYESSQNHDSGDLRPPWNVLSLDGGGVRGLAELLILEKIFRVMRQILDDRGAQPGLELKPCDYFDLIGGTSTGGLIAIMLGRLRLKLSVAIETFRDISKTCFPTDRRKWTVLKKGSGSFLYDDEVFATEIKKVVRSHEANEDLALKEEETLEPKCHVFVCAVVKETGSTVLLRSYSSSEEPYSPHSPVKIWEAARATSAAPLLFKPMMIKRPGVCQTLYDGALTDNNPINQVMNECTRLGKEREVGCVVSLGTGVKASAGFQGREHLVKLVKSLAEQSISCDNTHRRFIQSSVGRHLEDKERYFRFSVEKNLDEVKPDQWERSDAIQAYVNRYVEEHRVQIRKCAELLLSSRMEVSLRPNLNARRPASTQATPRRTFQDAERFRPDARASSTSLPTSLTINESDRSIVMHEETRLSESRTAARNPPAPRVGDPASADRQTLRTLDGDVKKQIVDVITTADNCVKRGSLAEAYRNFQLALTLLSKSESPTPMPRNLHCHVHLGMAECRILASDDKTKETALAYLESANKHAVEALDLEKRASDPPDQASEPAAQLCLIAISIKKTERKAEPKGMEPEDVESLDAKLIQHIEVLKDLDNRGDGTTHHISYKGLLTRAEAWRERLRRQRPE